MQEQKNISLDAYIADVRARRELAITRQPAFTANRGARLLARRVAKSLKHVQILVGQKLPSNQDIADYEKEAAQLLRWIDLPAVGASLDEPKTTTSIMSFNPPGASALPSWSGCIVPSGVSGITSISTTFAVDSTMLSSALASPGQQLFPDME